MPEPHASDPAAARVSKFQDGFERQFEEDDPNEKKKDHVAILTIKDKTDKEAVKMHECRVRRAEGSATLDSAQGYTEQRDVLLLKRWRDLAARKQSSVG